MQVSKIILVLLKAFIEILVASMKKDESNLDPVGCPLNAVEYDKCGYLLANFRQIIKDFEDEKE